MKSNRIILISLGVPALAFFVFWVAYRFYSPDSRGGHATQNRVFRVYADDGARLPMSVTGPTDAKEAIFIHADRGLDRNWNSRSARFRTGERLTKILSSRGFAVITHDQRDTGSGASQSYANIDDLAADFRVVVRAYFKGAPDKKNPPANKSYSILAHGQGCLAALRAVNREKLRPRRLFLVNCVYSGSLLQSWGDRILHNMRNAHVSPANLAQARKEFEAWLRNRPFEAKPGKSKPAKQSVKQAAEKKKTVERAHPDILGFRRALDFLQGPKMRDWTVQAANLYFERELRTALAHPNIRITHWISAFDTEFPPERVAEVRALARTFAARSPRYRFQELPRTNHFLKVQGGPAEGALSIIWNRVNPFARISPQVVREFSKAPK